jgi:1-acyl-sn-glycerol-3-phosphate acyltransferase
MSASPATPIQPRIDPLVYGVVSRVNRQFLRWYFGEIEIRGREHLPEQGPVVLAVKHYSRWDPLVAALLYRPGCWYMTNANQFSGIQGWLIQRLGSFPMDLAKPQLASFRQTIEILQNKQKLVIFPEGGIVRDQLLRTLKPGLARLVLQAERTASPPLSIPIVPVALRYLPTASYGAKVIVQVLPPLWSKDFDQGNDKHTAQALTEGLQATLIQGLTDLGMTDSEILGNT